MRRTLVVAALLSLGLSGVALAALPSEGSRAPAFALKDLFDETQTLSSSQLFRDHVTLVSFFATWCESCKKEIGVLSRLDTQYRGRGFQAVLVCLDIMGARNVRSYLEEAGGVGLRVLFDRAGTASSQYGVVQLPTNVLVGPDERVLLAWEAYQPVKMEEAEAHLASLPAAASPPTH